VVPSPSPSGGGRARRGRWSAPIGVLLLFCVGPLLFARPSASQRPSEYQVKAAFLYNFPNFVEWPPVALPDTATVITIGILGQDPFGDAFAPFVDKLVKGRGAVVKRSTRLQELPLCQVLFICDSERRYLPQILEHLRGRAILTVGETEGFADAGVMVSFFLQDKRVRFEINVDAAEASGLKFSAKLLKVAARIVGEEQP